MKKTTKTRKKRPKSAEEKEIRLSLRQIAVLTGHDRSFIARRISDAEVSPAGMRGMHLTYSASEIYRAFAAKEPTAADIELMAPIDRLAWHRGTRVRNDLIERAANLVQRADYESEMARVLRILDQGLEIAADLVASDEGATPAAVQRVRRHVESARQQIAETRAKAST